MRQADIAHQDFVSVARTVDDILDAHQTGCLALVLGLEAATPIENELDRLDILYGLGVRQMGIAYSDSNALGSGLRETSDGGLTAFGRRAVVRMNRLGMAIDVSHSSDRTGLDVCEVSEKPVFVTHAGARAVWDTSRMKTDDLLRAVAATGGAFGIEHVAFGPDTLHGDHVGLHRVFAKLLGLAERAAAGPAFERVPYVVGLESPTGNFRNIVGWLVKHGYTDTDIRAVIGGNIVRALREVW
jgi:membrane dipeptidase